MAEKWIQGAREEMKRKGTEGAFTKSSHAAGQSVGEHAKSVLANPRSSTTQKRRAVFAKNMRAIARRNR